MRKQKNEGITLIALVVTIIVLLILAGVTIVALMGDNGLLQRANDAVIRNSVSKVDEERKLLEQEAFLEGYPTPQRIAKTELTREEAIAAGWVFDGSEISGYTGSETELYIPTKINGVTIATLGTQAFMNNTNITKVITSAKVIGVQCFYGCSNLQHVLIVGENTEVIDDGAFTLCSKLEYIVLPRSLKNIGNSAFAATGLRSVFIPRGVLTVEDGAFTACRSLEKIHCEIEEKPEAWSDYILGSTSEEQVKIDWGYKN